MTECQMPSLTERRAVLRGYRRSKPWRRVEEWKGQSNVLGQGANGCVFGGRLLGSKWSTDVALKYVRSDEVLKGDVEEIKILRKLKDDNASIVGLIDCVTHGNLVCIILPLAPHRDLLNYMTMRQESLTEYETGSALQQLIRALVYLHAVVFIVHRDIRPQNILVWDNFNIKLADFGEAAEFEGKILTGVFGTKEYRAPEMIIGQTHGPKSDIWSLGHVVFNLAHLKMLKGARIEQIHNERSKSGFKDLRGWMLEPDPSQRADAFDVQNHRWLRIATRAINPNHIAITDPSSMKWADIDSDADDEGDD